MVSAISLVQSGKLKALAVGTAKRSDAMPQLPTTVEAGVPGSEYLFWVGMFAPAKTPAAIVDRLDAEVAKVMTSPDIKERLDKLGAEPFPDEARGVRQVRRRRDGEGPADRPRCRHQAQLREGSACEWRDAGPAAHAQRRRRDPAGNARGLCNA